MSAASTPRPRPLTEDLNADYAALVRDAQAWRRGFGSEPTIPSDFTLVTVKEWRRLQAIEQHYLQVLATARELAAVLARSVEG